MLAQIWIVSALSALLLFHLVCIPALVRKRNDFADVLWGPVFPLTALAAICYKAVHLGLPPFDPRSTIQFWLVLVWAVRLGYHVGNRNLSHATEDPRYNAWRKNWGNQEALWSYLKVWLLQSVIMLIIASPIIWVIAYPGPGLDLFSLAGLGLWLIGFYFEAVGDRQLRIFKANPANKGKIITSGLWAYSRHPNYFGEAALWWGIFLFALPLPYGWVTIASPLMITFLLLKVSGVPMLEAMMEGRPGWAEYRARVSLFLPLPARKS